MSVLLINAQKVCRNRRFSKKKALNDLDVKPEQFEMFKYLLSKAPPDYLLSLQTINVAAASEHHEVLDYVMSLMPQDDYEWQKLGEVAINKGHIQHKAPKEYNWDYDKLLLDAAGNDEETFKYILDKIKDPENINWKSIIENANTSLMPNMLEYVLEQVPHDYDWSKFDLEYAIDESIDSKNIPNVFKLLKFIPPEDLLYHDINGAELADISLETTNPEIIKFVVDLTPDKSRLEWETNQD
jgi:hypothetical protein